MKNIIHAIIMNEFFKYHKSLNDDVSEEFIEKTSGKISELTGKEKDEIIQKMKEYLECCNMINTLDMTDHLCIEFQL